MSSIVKIAKIAKIAPSASIVYQFLVFFLSFRANFLFYFLSVRILSFPLLPSVLTSLSRLFSLSFKLSPAGENPHFDSWTHLFIRSSWNHTKILHSIPSKPSIPSMQWQTMADNELLQGLGEMTRRCQRHSYFFSEMCLLKYTVTVWTYLRRHKTMKSQTASQTFGFL